MGFIDIVFIGVALSMDACAVAISNVLGSASQNHHRIWAVPVLFAVFQMLMPAIGYLIGSALAGLVGTYAPYLVAVVLGLLGMNMIRAGFADDDSQPIHTQLTWFTLIVQAVLTAIDALAVGVSFGALGVHPAKILIIGPVTFALVVIAIIIGRRLGEILGNKSSFVGGALLFIVALRALL